MNRSTKPHRGAPRGRSRGPRPATSPSDREPIEPLHPTADPPAIDSFREFELGDEIQAVIAGMGIEKPTPIQSLAIQPVLEGRDVIAKAETGTGKTLAFGAPMMARIDPARATVLGLVLCPTRELAQQVEGVLKELGASRGIRTALVVGGEPMHPQVAALKAGAQVVVGTPGRVLDLMNQGFLAFPWTEYVVLDEADEMLEIGFLPDVRKILEATPEERQTLLFSATFPTDLLRLAREATEAPAELATALGVSTVATIAQYFIETEDRVLSLVRLLEQSGPDDVFLVFCQRRTDVDQLFRRLERLPYGIKALHGGYDQTARFRVMSAFRTGEVKALLATDVAARGLDVAHVTHVINFAVPREVSDYTHRIGRTGRAGREGQAITLVSPEEAGRWRDLLRTVPWPIRERPAPGRFAERSERPAPEQRAPAAEPREERQPRRGNGRRDAGRRAEPERAAKDPSERRAGAGRRERAGESRAERPDGVERPDGRDRRDNGSRRPEPRSSEVEGARSREAEPARGAKPPRAHRPEASAPESARAPAGRRRAPPERGALARRAQHGPRGARSAPRWQRPR